jgi:hypothetical protein
VRTLWYPVCANITEALARARALYAEIGKEAPAVEHWGRRQSDHESSHEAAAARD